MLSRARQNMPVTLEDFDTFIREKINEKWSHTKISAYLVASYPGVIGLSTRSVQRYCAAENIHKTSRLNDLDLDKVVNDAVSKVFTCIANWLKYSRFAGSVSRSLKLQIPQLFNGRDKYCRYWGHRSMQG